MVLTLCTGLQSVPMVYLHPTKHPRFLLIMIDVSAKLWVQEQGTVVSSPPTCQHCWGSGLKTHFQGVHTLFLTLIFSITSGVWDREPVSRLRGRK